MSSENELAKQWMIKNATCPQLTQFVQKYRRVKVKEKNKKTLLNLIAELDEPDFEQGMLNIMHEQSQKRDDIKKKLDIKRKQKTKSTNAFNLLNSQLRINSCCFVKIRPTAFWDWQYARSGPGRWLTSYYGDIRSKICKIRVVAGLSKEDYSIKVEMVHDVTLECVKRPQMVGWEAYSTSPTNVIEFYEWYIKQNTPLVLKLSSEKDYKRMRSQNYRFYGQCTNTFEIMFSGTFFIAEQILQRIFPDAILFECCQFLID